MFRDKSYAFDFVYLTGTQQNPLRGCIGSPVALTSGTRSRATLDGTIKSNMNIVLSASVSSSALTTMARRRNSINPPCSAKWSLQIQEIIICLKFNAMSKNSVIKQMVFASHWSTTGSDDSPLATDHRDGLTGVLVMSTGGKVNSANRFISLSVMGEYAEKKFGGPHL